MSVEGTKTSRRGVSKMAVEKNKRRDQESSHKVYLWKYYRLQANFTSPQSRMSDFIYYTSPLSYLLGLSGFDLRPDINHARAEKSQYRNKNNKGEKTC